MELNLILAGVGGQGILSIAYVLDHAALQSDLHVKQAEVHDMAQRGGAVQSHLRISDRPIDSDLVPLGAADMILAVEPLEALRYAQYLAPSGVVVASTTPFPNIPDYPEPHDIYPRLEALPSVVLIDSERVARAAGSPKAQNIAMAGAAAPDLPIDLAHAEAAIGALFGAKGERIVEVNLRAFRAGMELGRCYRKLDAGGVARERIRRFQAKLKGGGPAEGDLPLWVELLAGESGAALLAALERVEGEISGDGELAHALGRAQGRVAEIESVLRRASAGGV